MRLGLAIAALPPALALALLAGAPALAQDSLPSVSDYRLPSATPTVRPQGPVDSDAPIVRRLPAAPAADESPATDTTAPAASASPASPAAASPRAATAGTAPRTASQASPRPAAAPAPAAPSPVTAAASPSAASPATSASAAAPGPAGDASASALPGTLESPGPWRVHSAREGLAEQALAIWPWLAGLAFVLGAGLMFLWQQTVMRRRLAALSAQDAAEPQLAFEPQPPMANPAPLTPELAEPVAAAESQVPEEEAELDLLSLLAEPYASDGAAHANAPPETAPRPSLDVLVNPLDVTLAARRMSATLLNTVLNYELVVSNNGSEPIGPVQVGGDMIGAHASLPTRSQLELAGQAIEPLHKLESLAPGESVTVTGEFRLPLAAITPIRNGAASLFVPLARFRVEALRKNAPPLTINRTFVIGESQDRPGAALKPFRLDLGPRLYSRISQREVALSA